MVGCQVSVTKKKAKMEKMEEKRRLLQVESQEGRVELPALNSSGSVSRSSVALEAKPTRSLQFCRRFLRHAEQLEFDCHHHQQSGAEARPLPRRFLRLAARRQNLPLRKTLVCVCLMFLFCFFTICTLPHDTHACLSALKTVCAPSVFFFFLRRFG